MNTMSEKEDKLIEEAVLGNKKALEELLLGVQDRVFTLSLRMLGMVQDAEDATQEILIKVMTHLGSFRRESSFSTWVFRIAANHLQSYRKNMFSKHPLSFEFYGEDIAGGGEREVPDLTGGVDRELLTRELKQSCTNVMLQCLDGESRCIFILGVMFRLDSRVAGEILGLTPEAYRQRLSRIRRRMAEFLGAYCGLGGGMCSCSRRVDYAVATHRLDPRRLEYSGLGTWDPAVTEGFVDAMEEMDDLSQLFAAFPAYRAPASAADFIRRLMTTESFSAVTGAQGGTLS